MSGRKVVRFTSSRSTRLEIPALDISGVNTTYTVFIAARIWGAGAPCGSVYVTGRILSSLASSPSDWLLGWDDSSADVFLSGSTWLPGPPSVPAVPRSTTWVQYTVTRASPLGDGRLFKYGSLISAGSVGRGPQGLSLGGQNTQFAYSNCVSLGYGTLYYYEWADADIAEVLVYPRALSDSDRMTVEAYLASRYNMSAVVVASITPSATPTPAATAPFVGSPSLDIIASPPLLWLRPEELPVGDMPVATWPNAAAVASAAAATAAGNAALAAQLTAAATTLNAVAPPANIPFVKVDPVSGFKSVRFTASRSTAMQIPMSALDLSGANANYTMFLVANIWGGYTACGTNLVTGRVLTAPPAASNDWVLGWTDGYRDVTLVAGKWIPGSPSVSAGLRNTAWLMYSSVRFSANSSVSLFRNGSFVGAASGARGGPAGLQLGGRSSTFSVYCAGYGTQNYAQFSDSAVAEVIVYNRALSDPERWAVEAYLNARYILASTAAGAPTPVPTSALPTGTGTRTGSPSGTGTPSSTRSTSLSASMTPSLGTTPSQTAKLSATPAGTTTSTVSGSITGSQSATAVPSASSAGASSPSTSSSTSVSSSSGGVPLGTPSVSGTSPTSSSGTPSASATGTASTSSMTPSQSPPPQTSVPTASTSRSGSSSQSVSLSSTVTPSGTTTPSPSSSLSLSGTVPASLPFTQTPSQSLQPSPSSPGTPSATRTAAAAVTASASVSASNGTAGVGAVIGGAAVPAPAALSAGAGAGVAIAVILCLLVFIGVAALVRRNASREEQQRRGVISSAAPGAKQGAVGALTAATAAGGSTPRLGPGAAAASHKSLRALLSNEALEAASTGRPSVSLGEQQVGSPRTVHSFAAVGIGAEGGAVMRGNGSAAFSSASPSAGGSRRSLFLPQTATTRLSAHTAASPAGGRADASDAASTTGGSDEFVMNPLLRQLQSSGGGGGVSSRSVASFKRKG